MNTLILSTITTLLTAACAEPTPEAPLEVGRTASPTPTATDVLRETPGSPAASTPDEAPVAALAFDHEHGAWTDLLAAHVEGPNLDYRGLAKQRPALDSYIASLAAVSAEDMGRWSRPQQYAFWINAYNAHVVKLILDNYPLESINDLDTLGGKVWKQRFIRLPAAEHFKEGSNISLDVIEHRILRPVFEDARVHAAVNCASESCPPLRAEAFRPAVLDKQLDEQVRAWLADPERNRYEPDSKTIRCSAIFNWFGGDFRRDAGSVEAWIARYAPEETAAWIRAAGDDVRVKSLPYSWKLNDVPR